MMKKNYCPRVLSILTSRSDLAWILSLCMAENSKIHQKSGSKSIKKLLPMIVHSSKGYQMAITKYFYFTCNIEISKTEIFDPSKKIVIF